MIPHSIGKFGVVLAIDFERQQALVGEASPSRSGSLYVFRHYRLRVVDGGLVRDDPRHKAKDKCPALDDEDAWLFTNTSSLGRVDVTWERAPLLVSRVDLKRALDHVSKLSGKSLGFDGLVTLELQADGLSLTSHGDVQLQWSCPCEPARDNLGTATVSTEYLRSHLREISSNTIALGVSRGSLLVDGYELWTVNAAPRHALAVPNVDGVRNPELANALRRAARFVGSADRPSLANVWVFGHRSHANVFASDGDCGYKDSVDGDFAAFGLSSFGIPGAVLARFKKAHTAWLAIDQDKLWLTFGRYAICVQQSPLATCPPYDSVFDEGGSTCEVKLTPKLWHEWRDWLSNYTATTHLHFGQNKDGEAGIRCLIDDGEQLAAETFGNPNELAPIKKITPSDNSPARRAAWLIDRAVQTDLVVKALNAFDDDATIRVRFSGSYDPIVFTDGDRTVLVMPLRV